jgi:hypothetical protein
MTTLDRQLMAGGFIALVAGGLVAETASILEELREGDDKIVTIRAIPVAGLPPDGPESDPTQAPLSLRALSPPAPLPPFRKARSSTLQFPVRAELALAVGWSILPKFAHGLCLSRSTAPSSGPSLRAPAGHHRSP